MIVAAEAACARPAQIAANGGGNRHLRALRHQHGALLDVKLQEGAGVGGGEAGGALAAQRVHIEAERRHVPGESAPCVGAPQRVQVIVGERAEGEAGADEGDAEPDALLGSGGDGGYVAARLPADVAERGEHDQAGDGAGQPVVVPAGRHGIGVRAGEDGGCAPVAAGERAVEVARVVEGGLEPERAGGVGDARGGELVLFAPGGAGHADVGGAGRANLVEQRVRERQAGLHRGAQRLRAHGAKTSRISS